MNYYNLLGVSYKVNDKEIKKAYSKLKKTREIEIAFNTLIDDEKRLNYDISFGYRKEDGEYTYDFEIFQKTFPELAKNINTEEKQKEINENNKMYKEERQKESFNRIVNSLLLIVISLLIIFGAFLIHPLLSIILILLAIFLFRIYL
jgi:DnaJ-class molecular chaperone